LYFEFCSFFVTQENHAYIAFSMLFQPIKDLIRKRYSIDKASRTNINSSPLGTFGALI
jgi:hypothetical protein